MSVITNRRFQANDLDASATIDLERVDVLRDEIATLEKRAAEKRAKAAELRRASEEPKTGTCCPL